MPVFTQGAEEAKRLDEEAKAARGNRHRIQTYTFEDTLKEGKPVLMRFLTDYTAWIAADTHQFIPTKDKPEEWEGNWPKAMWGICSRDRMFRLRDASGKVLDEFEEGWGNCYIHNAYAGKKDRFDNDMSVPAPQVYGLAALRDVEVDPATSEVIGIKDQMAEYRTEDKKTIQVPRIVVVSQKYINFWGALKASVFGPSKTVCDKDYNVERIKNDYNISNVYQTPDHKPGTPSWGIYDEALRVMGFSLQDWLLERASEDWYKRWWIPGAVPAGGYKRGGSSDSESDGESGGSAAPATSPAGPQVDQSALAGYREKLAGRGAK